MSLTSLRSSQTVVNAALAAVLAALVVWVGPPGTDFPAHVFQLDVFVKHGFALWTNYWYAGRYTFVGYSLLYYPLAALVGIRLLAVISVAASAAAFTLVDPADLGRVERLGGAVLRARRRRLADHRRLPLRARARLRARRRSSRSPAAGSSGSRCSRCSPSPRARSPSCSCCSCSPPPASPAPGARSRSRPLIVGAICVLGARPARLFPDPGRYPFPVSELARRARLLRDRRRPHLAARARPDPARPLHRLRRRSALLSFAVPSNLGGNVVRLRLAAVPIAILVALAAPLAAAPRRDRRPRARGRLEPLAARLQLLELGRRPRRRAPPTGSR